MEKEKSYCNAAYFNINFGGDFQEIWKKIRSAQKFSIVILSNDLRNLYSNCQKLSARDKRWKLIAMKVYWCSNCLPLHSSLVSSVTWFIEVGWQSIVNILWFQELEEENEHMNDELRQLTAKNRRLQEAYDSIKEQLANPAPTSQVFIFSVWKVDRFPLSAAWFSPPHLSTVSSQITYFELWN